MKPSIINILTSTICCSFFSQCLLIGGGASSLQGGGSGQNPLAFLMVLAGGGAGGSSTGASTSSATQWVLEAYLKTPNSGTDDSFGFGLSISGDTIVVGAFVEDSNQITITNGTSASTDNSASDSGAAYVFVRSGNSWSQQAYLKAPNTTLSDFFGYNVSISGDTIVVGSPLEDSNQTTITNGSTANSDNSVSNTGAAYVFIRSGTTWSQQAYLKAPNAEAEDRFGQNVSISGDTIVVGAWLEDSNQTTISNGATASSNNSATDSGAAYVFVRSGTTWSQQAYLKAPNTEANDLFSLSLSVSGDTIVVGARLEDSNQTTIINGATASSNNSATDSGAAYVFVRLGTTWSQQAYLKAPNAEADDRFGENSISVSGDTIIIGASADDSSQTTITTGTTASSNNSATDSGSAHVFVRSGTTWSQQAYLKAPNAEANDRFGLNVAVSGDTIVVGARLEDSNQTTITNGTTASSNNSATDSGAVYIFVRK